LENKEDNKAFERQASFQKTDGSLFTLTVGR